MAPFVDGSLPWGRFEARLAGKIVAADPETAAAREAERAAEQFAKRTRSSEHGTAGFYVRSTVGVIARVEATVAFLADALTAFGDRDAEDLRRVKALVLMANPVKAVELLAAFAALRARGVDVDVELPEPAEPSARRVRGQGGLDGLDQPGGLDGLDQPVADEGTVRSAGWRRSRGGWGSSRGDYRRGSPPARTRTTGPEAVIHRCQGSGSTGRSCCPP